MSIRKVSLAEGEYYHIYNRGNSKQLIFKDKKDYQRFMEILYLANTSENFNIFDLKRFQKELDIFSIKKSDQLVAIGAYCLMPNHFHLLITSLVDGGISKFMQKVSTAYSMYFNKKYQRTGSLFEGKFKSEHLNEDRYLKYIFSYIHLNPIKLIDKSWKEKGIKDTKKALLYLSGYTVSSYSDYLEIARKERNILNKDCFPKYFPNKNVFIEEILNWITYARQDLT